MDAEMFHRISPGCAVPLGEQPCIGLLAGGTEAADPLGFVFAALERDGQDVRGECVGAVTRPAIRHARART